MASRRRSVSERRSISPTNNMDRCSSTGKLDESISKDLINAGESTETVCGLECMADDKTAGAAKTTSITEPLEIKVDDNLDDTTGTNDVNFQNLLNIDDTDEEKLEDECKRMELEVKSLEQKVEELERKRFADDVPRTLVDRIIEKRRELRELDVQLYMINLAESDGTSDNLSQLSSTNGSPGNSRFWNERYGNVDPSMYMTPGNNAISNQCNTSKFGSQLKPGQENTADILNAIPPSGSLQHRQYLSKASTDEDMIM